MKILNVKELKSIKNPHGVSVKKLYDTMITLKKGGWAFAGVTVAQVVVVVLAGIFGFPISFPVFVS